MSRVLVTGGSGFIGTNLCEALLRRGDVVSNADIVAPRAADHASLWRAVDVRDGAALRRHLGEFAPDIVFHLAARTDLAGGTIEAYSANTRGVENLIEAARASSTVHRVVFASSRLVCKIGYQPKAEDDYCPTTVYGESKTIGERSVRARSAGAGWDWIIVRPTSIWGPWFGVPYRLFFDAVARGRYVHPTGLRVSKSFGYVENTVHQLLAIAAARSADVHTRTLYLADYPPIDVLQMAREIRTAIGGDGRVREVPLRLLDGAARLGDALQRFGWREPPLTSFRLGNLTTPMVHDLAPLEALVGALPFGMPQGIRRTLDWMRAHGGLH